MRLVNNWRAVLTRAWSVRLLLLAGLLTGIEAALPFLGELVPLSPGVLAAVSFLVVMGALVARLLAQKSIGETS